MRSLGETGITCPSNEPIAPPVTMIGPSAPNGPPVPIAIAAETGFAMAVRGAIRLCLVRTASIASGIPWPRMIGAHFAIRPTSSPPVTATTRIHGLRCRCVNDGSVQADPVEEHEVRDQRDEVHEHVRGRAGHHADERGQTAQQEHSTRRRHGSHALYRSTI